MRVNINAGGRDVTIETSDTNVTPGDIAAKALEIWKATDGAKSDTEGPAYGFVPERRPAAANGYHEGHGLNRPIEVR